MVTADSNMSPRALILTGAGRRADKWHDYAATSASVADVLAEAGIACQIRSAKPASLADADDWDLLVVNCGTGPVNPEFDGADDEWADFRAAIEAWLAAGKPMLGVHISAGAFPDMPTWPRLLGGAWVETSWHPPISDASVEIDSDAHVIAQTLSDFTVYDERYTDLAVAPDVTAYAFHTEGGERHPIAWARTEGDARIVYDALGHGPEAYASEGRRDLLRREADWLLERI